MDRRLMLGAGAVAVAIAIAVGIAIAATSGGDGDSADASDPEPRSSSSSSTRSSTTTSTTTTTVPVAPTTASATPPAPAPAPGATGATDPASAYEPAPLPAGVTTTISGCRWVPDSGGQLQAEGTITNVANVDDFFVIEVFWLQRNGNQNEDVASQTELIDLAVGQSLPWRLTQGADGAPPGLSCALEVE